MRIGIGIDIDLDIDGMLAETTMGQFNELKYYGGHKNDRYN